MISSFCCLLWGIQGYLLESVLGHVARAIYIYTLRRECLALMNEAFFNHIVLTTVLKQKAFQNFSIVRSLTGLCFLY